MNRGRLLVRLRRNVRGFFAQSSTSITQALGAPTVAYGENGGQPSPVPSVNYDGDIDTVYYVGSDSDVHELMLFDISGYGSYPWSTQGYGARTGIRGAGQGART